MSDPIDCPACRARIPLIWFVQGKKYMHEAPGLSVTSCARIDAERKAAAKARGNDRRRR